MRERKREQKELQRQMEVRSHKESFKNERCQRYFLKMGFTKDPAMQILKTNIHGTLLFQ